MGMGYEGKCSECGKTHEFILGVGMFYPSSCEELTEAVCKGEYGEKHKQALLKHPDALVDAEVRLYQCECGYWNSYDRLDICETEETNEIWNVVTDPKEYKYRMIKRKEHSGWRWGEPYIIKKYDHICPKCGKKMKDITKNWHKKDLICTKCGKGKISCHMSTCWD